jgi:Tfp pilus assembly protein PilV
MRLVTIVLVCLLGVVGLHVVGLRQESHAQSAQSAAISATEQFPAEQLASIGSQRSTVNKSFQNSAGSPREL